MSVVIIGGNERMVTQYENICKEHGCKANGHQRDAGSEEESDSGSTCTYQQCDSTSRGSGRALRSIHIKQLPVNGGSEGLLNSMSFLIRK